MININNFARLVLITVLVCGSASAVDFDFTREDATGGELAAYLEKNGLTVTSYYAPDAKSTLQQGLLFQNREFGLAGCFAEAAKSENCAAIDPKAESQAQFAFLLFRFSAPTNLSSIGVGNYDSENKLTDRNFTYYTTESKDLSHSWSAGDIEKAVFRPNHNFLSGKVRRTD